MPAPSSIAETLARPAPTVQYRGVAVAIGLTLALALYLGASGWRMPTLLLVGVVLGITLQHGGFGFTSAYRTLFVRAEVSAVRAQLLMLALATALFAPLLAQGEAFGMELTGAVAPLGVQVLVGAFVFGIGMQLGGGCGSGTLYTVGGGNARMVIVLVAFCAGSFWASLHMGWWQALPDIDSVTLGEVWGWWTAAFVQVAALLALYVLLGRFGKIDQVYVPAAAQRRSRWWRGPWPLAWAALALALLNVATLIVAGHPWTIT